MVVVQALSIFVQVREHVWFADLDWEEVDGRRMLPPILPKVGQPDSWRSHYENYNTNVVNNKYKLSSQFAMLPPATATDLLQ